MTNEDGLVAYESGNPMNLEAGLYAAKVNSIEEIDGQFGPQWRLEFALDDHPDDKPWAWATAKLGTRSKLYKWATALLGRPLAVGERLTKEQLVGRPCTLIIKERPDVEAADGVRRYVDDLLAVKKSAAKPKPDADTCFCGGALFAYAANGAALCEKHSKEASE
jgi:hypothetical protein